MSSQLGSHRGAIDPETITTARSPQVVMQSIKEILHSMGISFREESDYKYRCVRPRNKNITVVPKRSFSSLSPSVPSVVLNLAEDEAHSNDDSDDHDDEDTFIPITNTNVLYGSNTREDPGDEVRFSVELTSLGMLPGTYSLDIRRMKGNLRSYQFLYNTIRNHANLKNLRH